MARQVDSMAILVTHTRQPDGTYVTAVSVVEGVISDPAGATQLDRTPAPVRANYTWNPAELCSAMRVNCETLVKAAGGVP